MFVYQRYASSPFDGVSKKILLSSTFEIRSDKLFAGILFAARKWRKGSREFRILTSEPRIADFSLFIIYKVPLSKNAR